MTYIPPVEQEAAKDRVEAKREHRRIMAEQGNNYSLPILSKAPFVTSLKVGQTVSIRSLSGGGDHPLYYVDDGWTVMGYRWSEAGMIKELIVLQKKDSIINMAEKDIRV